MTQRIMYNAVGDAVREAGETGKLNRNDATWGLAALRFLSRFSRSDRLEALEELHRGSWRGVTGDELSVMH